MGARFRAFELAFTGHFNIVVVEFAEEGLLLINVILVDVDGVAVFDGGVLFFPGEFVHVAFFVVIEVFKRSSFMRFMMNSNSSRASIRWLMAMISFSLASSAWSTFFLGGMAGF